MEMTGVGSFDEVSASWRKAITAIAVMHMQRLGATNQPAVEATKSRASEG